MSTRRLAFLGSLLALLFATLPGAGFAAASQGKAEGAAGVITGTVPLRGMNVVLMQAAPGGRKPVRIGSARSGRGGGFTLRYSGDRENAVTYILATRPGGGAEAGFPVPGQSYRLGAVVGLGIGRHLQPRIKVTERTTVAMGFSMAQFIGAGDRVAGPDPGLRNAASMNVDLVDSQRGGLGEVLRTYPNGKSTSTVATFDSLANLLALCRHQDRACARFLSKARAPGAGPAPDTLAAAVDIARYPWHDVTPLYKLSLAGHRGGHWQPSLDEEERPDAWTLALRFESDPPALDGPGNFAIDHEGNIWVANNYAYDRDATRPTCGSDKVFRFRPDGGNETYEGGGLSGVGFGITIDPANRVWLGNFGFEGKGCTTAANHYSVSTFRLDGTVLSPSTGWEVGDVSWPQGTISDQKGNIWLANCGNDSVTEITPPRALWATGPPPAAVNFGEAEITGDGGVGFERPFADAVNAQGQIFVTGNASDSVARLSPSGAPLGLVTGGGLHLPMGIAGDDNGYMWVSNSRWVVAPCPGKRPPNEVLEKAGKGGGDVTLLKPDGKVAPGSPIKGAGLFNPWGIAVDGAGQVWVANFGGQRLSELCGTSPRNCPPGHRRTGAAISPSSGYGFDGLVRNTGVAVDPSGNVWLANNWKNVPIQTNPGGYQIVAYLGLAAPVKSPQIGPPQRP